MINLAATKNKRDISVDEFVSIVTKVPVFQLVTVLAFHTALVLCVHTFYNTYLLSLM